MRRLDVRPNGTQTTDGAGPAIVRLQQALLGKHHCQRNAAEPGTRVVEEAPAVEQMMAGDSAG